MQDEQPAPRDAITTFLVHLMIGLGATACWVSYFAPPHTSLTRAVAVWIAVSCGSAVIALVRKIVRAPHDGK